MCTKTPPPPEETGPPAPAAPPAQDPAEAPKPNEPLTFEQANKAGTSQLVKKRNFIPTPNIGSGIGTALSIPT